MGQKNCEIRGVYNRGKESENIEGKKERRKVNRYD